MCCNCGWHAWWWRKTKYKGFIRSAYKCGIFFHDWDEAFPVETGAIIENEDGTYTSEIDEGKGEILGYTKQCNRCWKCVTT